MVGTQINGAPHLGTNLVQTAAFLLAKIARRDADFDEMFARESVASVNPLATRQEQLANIRQIYPPEREALGIVAIGIELVDPPRRGAAP